MILYINTKDQKKVIVGLQEIKGGKLIAELCEDKEYGSQILLPLVEELLSSQKLKYADLTSIEVETGPGSFTGLRVGVSVANALGFSLKIPVNGKKMEDKLVY